MNKKELVLDIAKTAKVTQDEARRCLNAFEHCITKSLKKKDKVVLVGFGTFETKERVARDGRNPKTGEPVKIAAATVPSFKVGKVLKESVQK